MPDESYNFECELLKLEPVLCLTSVSGTKDCHGYSRSQNSIFSRFGPSMVKNFTPRSQNGRPFT